MVQNAPPPYNLRLFYPNTIRVKVATVNIKDLSEPKTGPSQYPLQKISAQNDFFDKNKEKGGSPRSVV